MAAPDGLFKFEGVLYECGEPFLPRATEVAQLSGQLAVAQRLHPQTAEPATLWASDDLRSSSIDKDDAASWELFHRQQAERRSCIGQPRDRVMGQTVPPVIGRIQFDGSARSGASLDNGGFVHLVTEESAAAPYRIALEGGGNTYLRYSLHILSEASLAQVVTFSSTELDDAPVLAAARLTIAR